MVYTTERNIWPASFIGSKKKSSPQLYIEYNLYNVNFHSCHNDGSVVLKLFSHSVWQYLKFFYSHNFSYFRYILLLNEHLIFWSNQTNADTWLLIRHLMGAGEESTPAKPSKVTSTQVIFHLFFFHTSTRNKCLYKFLVLLSFKLSVLWLAIHEFSICLIFRKHKQHLHILIGLLCRLVMNFIVINHCQVLRINILHNIRWWMF